MGMMGRANAALANWSREHMGAVPSPVDVNLGALADALGGTADMVNQYVANPILAAQGYLSGTTPYQFPTGVAQAAVPQPQGMLGKAGRTALAMAIPVPGGKTGKAVQALEEVGALGRLAHADSPAMISTRRPSPAGMKTYGNPDQQLLTQSGEAMRLSPEAWEGNMQQMKELPMMADVRARNPDKIAEVATRRGADNLKAIVEAMPAEKVEAARHWYPVAGQLSAAQAARTGFSPEAGAGVYAVTSPQTMWDINVGKGDRLMQMAHEGWNSSQAEQRAGQDWVTRRLDSGNPGAVAGLGQDYAARIMATPMEELATDMDRYAKTVLTDAVRNNPRVPKIGVDGTYGPATYPITWGSGKEVGKALNILADPSMETIAAQMQGGGKVPSFYNNIIAPSSDAGIATIDTHSAGAASLFPGGGKDPVVYRAMGLSAPKGGAQTSMSSASTGAKGHYGLFQDMHQLAGDELGMLPREVQSATWEGVRDLWGQSGKTPQLKADIDSIWRSSDNPDAARAAIFDRLGRPQRSMFGYTAP